MGRKEDNNFIHFAFRLFHLRKYLLEQSPPPYPSPQCLFLGSSPPSTATLHGDRFVLHESPQGIWPPVPLNTPLAQPVTSRLFS